MKFKRQDNYYELSDCEKYTVCACLSKDSWMFAAWRCGNPPILLGMREKAEDARNLCRNDAGKTEKVA